MTGIKRATVYSSLGSQNFAMAQIHHSGYRVAFSFLIAQ